MGRSGLRPYMTLQGVRECLNLGGEAVGGDGVELPGGELVEVFFGGGGGEFQGAGGLAVDAGGDGVAVVADEFGDAGVEEEGEVAERPSCGRDFDCFAVYYEL